MNPWKYALVVEWLNIELALYYRNRFIERIGRGLDTQKVGCEGLSYCRWLMRAYYVLMRPRSSWYVRHYFCYNIHPTFGFSPIFFPVTFSPHWRRHMRRSHCDGFLAFFPQLSSSLISRLRTATLQMPYRKVP